MHGHIFSSVNIFWGFGLSTQQPNYVTRENHSRHQTVVCHAPAARWKAVSDLLLIFL